MSDNPALEACQQLLPGDNLAEFLASVRGKTTIGKFSEEVAGDIDEYVSLPDFDILISEGEGGQIARIIFQQGFPGTINQIRIGMSGDEVEEILGPPDRLWPMPHPNFILLYDAPTFFHVEVDRKTEKVITMIR
jgi:hypothetical protein